LNPAASRIVGKMEPVITEMNVPVAITVVIGMIGIISWFLVKNFENKLRANPSMAADGLISGDFSSTETDVNEEEVEEKEEVEEEEEEEEREGAEAAEAEDVQDFDHEVEPNTNIESEELLEVETDTNHEQTQTHTDTNTFHEKIEEIDTKLEGTRTLVTELCQTVIDTNNTTKDHFNKTLDALDSKVTANIQDIAYSTATSLSRIEASTNESLSTLRQSTQKMSDVLSSVQISLGEYARARELSELKTQIDELLKRSTIQKSVYQAWNGASKWTDFNEGELNIQMIRKKFMTTEQNEEWLLPENKKIAAYNRDQLLGLNEDTWTTTDNTVFVKRYYKDDWDSSIEVAITVTLSKKILVPPGGKPETIITHILKRLSEKEQITWEHLLVNV
jgi:hypothetical protein